MTTELKQTLFKAGVGLAAFGFAATGHELAGPLTTALVGLAGNVASQFGVDACMPYITEKWLSHPEKVVNHHIQRALVAAIHAALSEIEADYLVRDDVSPREAQSLRGFFAVLRDRSQLEYVDATRDELGQQEVLNYVYDRAAATKHLQERLRIKWDATSDEDAPYFTDRFIAFFPNRFAELVQFHFKEQLKGNKDDQEKAKKAMDLLFFDTLNAGLKKINTGQQELRQLLDGALQTNTKTLQQVEFYGEIWISAIRKNRDQLDRVEQNTESILNGLGLVGMTLEQVRDLLHKVLSQSVQPGLLVSVQFIDITQKVRDAEQAFIKAQTDLSDLEISVVTLENMIAQNPTLAEGLNISLIQQKQSLSEKQINIQKTDADRQQIKQHLTQFLSEIANTQKAILEATSHRADQARKLFEQGLFAEANTALNADDLRRDKAELLQQRDTVQRQLEQLAQDFILKANMIVLNKEPDWFAQARRLFEEAVEVNETYGTCYDLAYFLANHNNHHSAVLFYEQALRLANTAFEKSATLNNLANLYQNTARPQQAEAAYDEALSVYRQLAEQNPATYLPDVAMTLNNLAILYSGTARPQQAEAAYDEALSVYRQLAEQNPATYLPDVATTLNNLAILYSGTARPQQAEAAYDEALSVYRQLAEQNSATYLPDVATTLNNLAILYSGTARPQQAEAAYDEALSVYRQLAEQNPATYLPDVATTLNNLANLYQNTARPQQAEAAYDEALSVYRQLAEQNPATYLPDVAMTLNNLAILYSGTARPQQAEAAYDEALSVYRQLAEQNPATYLPYVATTLNNLAILYRNTGRPQQAEAAYDEALSVRRQLAEQNPATYLPYVATTLNNLAILYRNTGRPQQAEAAYDEALSVYRQLAEQNSATYLPYVAMTLNNLANLYSDTARPQQAEAAYDEALSVYRQLAEQNPATYLPDVAMTLNNLAILYSGTARPQQAEAAYDEALQTRLNLARKQPDSYAVYVAETAYNMSLMYLQRTPEPERDKSIDWALVAINWALPYVERVDYARKLGQQAVSICEYWGIDWQVELQKRLDDANGQVE